jgi:hypothetical protein
MTSRLLRSLTILAVALTPAAVAMADFPPTGQVYDTVDAIQSSPSLITVTGIVAGQSAPTTSSYVVATGGVGDPIARCDRFALLAISKPGKFRFATVSSASGNHFDCQLITRAP